MSRTRVLSSRLIAHLRQEEGNDASRQEKEAGVKQGQAMIADVGEQPEENGAKSGGDAADVVTESRAGRPQKSWEQRRQINGKQGEKPLEKANDRKPKKHAHVIARHAVGPQHGQKIPKAHPGNGLAIADEP